MIEPAKQYLLIYCAVGFAMPMGDDQLINFFQLLSSSFSCSSSNTPQATGSE